MANFTPTKHEANEYNGGVQYIDSNPAQGIEGDGLQAQTVNNLVESALWTQEEVVSAKETADDAYSVASEANDKVNNFIESQDAPPPVGYHYIQYNGEPTPASRWAGTTWEVDTAYVGKTLIGSGIVADKTYALGDTGGSATHNHEGGNLYAKIAVSTDANTFHFGTTYNITDWYCEQNRQITMSRLPSGGNMNEGVGVRGTSANASSMQPYAVVNYWKRTA